MKKRTILYVCVFSIVLLIILLAVFPLSRLGKNIIVSVFDEQLADFSEKVASSDTVETKTFLFYKIRHEKTGIVTFSHYGFYIPFLSPYTEQTERGVYYSADRLPKGLSQSLLYSDFDFETTENGWMWEEDKSMGDNAMFVQEIIPGWFYYEWQW